MEELIAWVKDGPYRLKILLALEQRSYLPSELANKFEINRASVSRIMKNLKEKNLVIPTRSGSRTCSYSTTDLGKKLMSKIKND